jgi:hypothetical protein
VVATDRAEAEPGRVGVGCEAHDTALRCRVLQNRLMPLKPGL